MLPCNLDCHSSYLVVYFANQNKSLNKDFIHVIKELISTI